MSSEPRVRWNLTSLDETKGIWHGYGTLPELRSSVRIDRTDDGRFRAIVACDGEPITVNDTPRTLAEAQAWCEVEIAKYDL